MAASWNAVAHLVDALCQWTTYRMQALRGAGGCSDSPGILRLGTVTASQNVRSSVNSKEYYLQDGKIISVSKKEFKAITCRSDLQRNMINY